MANENVALAKELELLKRDSMATSEHVAGLQDAVKALNTVSD